MFPALLPLLPLIASGAGAAGAGAAGAGAAGAGALGAGLGAGALGTGALGAGLGAGAAGVGAAGTGLGAGALGAGGGLLSAAAPAATGGTFGSILSGATPIVGSGFGSTAGSVMPVGSIFGSTTTPLSTSISSAMNPGALIPSASSIPNLTNPLIAPGTPATPGMFDGLGGALSTGLENLNKVAQPAANISQAVSPFMSKGQGIQASPIAPPTYSNNLNEIVAQNEETDQQRMEEELMRRFEQRKKIQDLALGGAA